MAIITSEIIFNRPKSDGRRVKYRFTDHVGDIHEIVKPLAIGVDVNADMAAHTAIIETQLQDDEEVGAIQSADVLNLVLNPIHSTSKRLAKYLIRLMVRERDPRIVLILEPLINYLRTNYTAQQLRTFLDVTNAQLTQINNKVDSILNNKTVFDTFNSETGDIDG